MSKSLEPTIVILKQPRHQNPKPKTLLLFVEPCLTSRSQSQSLSPKMASKLFLKNDSKLALDFLRKSAFFTRPTQLAPPSTQTLNQKSQNPQHSAFSLAADFLGVHQKLFTGEEAFLSVRGSSLGEALWARGSGGSSSRGKIDREENIDDDEVDEFDDKDFVDEGMMDYEFDEEHHDDGDYWDSQDDDDDDVKDKKSRKKW